ncbi:hypothetical protein DYB32_007039 [Aphanomyces invadans]|uniref:Uncharacterized protein n=1 Tax=Aphanomyces invadans TaxID=157072 RepID=A0A418APW1_9STRA|nr:hypothetical protein DYB32_007039 [Aphanomyces invadans]
MRGSLAPTLVGSSLDEEDAAVCSFVRIQQSPCSQAMASLRDEVTAGVSDAASRSAAAGLHPAAVASWDQMRMLPVMYLSYLGTRTYMYANMIPIVAVLLLCGLSVDYFWMSSAILRHDTGIHGPDPAQPLCIQLTAAQLPCSPASWKSLARPVSLVVVVSIVMGCALAGAAATGLAVLIGRVDGYTHELIVLGGVTGVASGGAAMLCPSWRAAATLVVYALAFFMQSVNWVAFELEAVHHLFVVDNGELLAQVHEPIP